MVRGGDPFRALGGTGGGGQQQADDLEGGAAGAAGAAGCARGSESGVVAGSNGMPMLEVTVSSARLSYSRALRW